MGVGVGVKMAFDVLNMSSPTEKHTDVLTNNACVKRRTALMHV